MEVRRRLQRADGCDEDVHGAQEEEGEQTGAEARRRRHLCDPRLRLVRRGPPKGCDWPADLRGDRRAGPPSRVPAKGTLVADRCSGQRPGACGRGAAAAPRLRPSAGRRRLSRRSAEARIGGRLTRPRAVVVVTGTELVRGDRHDLNGPFLAAELHRLGLEASRITIVGDRVEELEAAIAEGLQSDVLVLSGGLGPTHDDRTIELLGAAAGRKLEVDPELEAEIETVSRRIAERLRRPYGEFAMGVRKQASLPVGALSLGLAGTAPGVVL